LAQTNRRPLIKRINRGAILLAVLLVFGIVFIAVEKKADANLPEMAEKAVQEYISEHPDEKLETRRYMYEKINRISLTKRSVVLDGRVSGTSNGMVSDYFEYERSGLGWKLVYMKLDSGAYSETYEIPAEIGGGY